MTSTINHNPFRPNESKDSLSKSLVIKLFDIHHLEWNPALRTHGEWIRVGVGVATHAPRMILNDGPLGNNTAVW